MSEVVWARGYVRVRVGMGYGRWGMRYAVCGMGDGVVVWWWC